MLAAGACCCVVLSSAAAGCDSEPARLRQLSRSASAAMRNERPAAFPAAFYANRFCCASVMGFITENHRWRLACGAFVSATGFNSACFAPHAVVDCQKVIHAAVRLQYGISELSAPWRRPGLHHAHVRHAIMVLACNLAFDGGRSRAAVVTVSS